MRASQALGEILALAAAVSAQEECDYSKGHTCIKPQTTAAVALPFPTLFPASSPPSFVFAVDDLEHADIIAITANNKDVQVPAASANGPIQALSWWLSFGNGTANLNRTQERAYTAFALESNSTKDIGGADGGCEGLLGAECVADLKALFTDKNTLSIGSSVATGALMKYFASPPASVRCPSIYWGDGSGRDLSLYGTSDSRPLVANSNWIARYSAKLLIGQELIPGNASFTHGRTTMRFRSFDAQKALAIVAFSLAYPAGGPGDRADNVLNLACLRVGQAAKESTGGGTSGSGSGDKKNAGAMLSTSNLGALATALVALLFAA